MRPNDSFDPLRERALRRQTTVALSNEVRKLGPLAARYFDGDTRGAWDELLMLGPAVRQDSCWSEAWGIAWETMWRVRMNLQNLLRRYRDVGYRLKSDRPLGSPASTQHLDTLEREAGGPIPLSMRAFWEVVGSVDLSQSEEQNVHDWLDEAEPASELELLGDDDPLYVDPVEHLLEDLA